jgi:hypothetical protein
MDRCGIPRCRDEADVIYLGHPVCQRHWDELAAEDAPPDALRMALGVEGGHRAAVEGRAMDGQKQDKAADQADAASAKVKGKARTKKAAPVKATAKAEAPAEKPARKKEEVVNPVVFAFRLSAADRDRIHDAAGPAKATKFVRGAALAAATGDIEAFKQLVAGRASK